MGVPGFFAWLLKNKNKLGASNLILSQLDIQIDWLMLDTNCLLHPCITHVLEKYKKNLLNIDTSKNIRNQIEKIIWENIEMYIDNMIDEIKPEYIYIGIDGVAPMGKILQQRQRRYRYLFDKKIKLESTELRELDFEIPITSIELTPGTDYMERINKCMEKYVKKLGNRGIKCVYSSYHEEGEGEHKILQYIKNNLSVEDSIVIYGLDADLLFLSLGLNTSKSNLNLYVMREKQVFTNNPVDMDKIINKSNESNYNFVKISELELLIINLNTSIEDFIILCYLIGNDFLPGLLTIDIKKGGLDKIFKAWENVKQNLGIDIEYESDGKIKSHLVLNDNSQYKISLEILKELFEELIWTEKNIWKNINRDNLMNQDNMDLEQMEQMEKMKYSKQNDKNNLMKKFLNGTSSNTDFLDKIEFSCSNEYYSYYLGINSIHIDNNIIQKMVQEYINGIEWCINYYLDECISWSQRYNFMIAPLIEDIVYFFPSKTTIKKDSRILKPVEQLILAIPSETWKYVIEKNIIDSINENNNIGYMFPKEFSIDINKENLYWKCLPMIPMVEYKEYIKEMKKINIKNEKNLIYKYIKNF